LKPKALVQANLTGQLVPECRKSLASAAMEIGMQVI